MLLDKERYENKEKPNFSRVTYGSCDFSFSMFDPFSSLRELHNPK